MLWMNEIILQVFIIKPWSGYSRGRIEVDREKGLGIVEAFGTQQGVHQLCNLQRIQTGLSQHILAAHSLRNLTLGRISGWLLF